MSHLLSLKNILFTYLFLWPIAEQSKKIVGLFFFICLSKFKNGLNWSISYLKKNEVILCYFKRETYSLRQMDKSLKQDVS